MLIAIRTIKEDIKVHSRYAYQKVSYRKADLFIYFLLNLISMGTFKFNEKIILYRLTERQEYLLKKDQHANGAMPWIKSSLSF